MATETVNRRPAVLAPVGRQVSQVAGRRLPLAIRILMVVLALGTFMTESKFLPVRNNIGIFEVAAGVLIVAWIVHFNRHRLPVHQRPIIVIMVMWFVIAFASLSQLPISRINIGSELFYLNLLQSTVFLFQFLLTLALFNLLILDEAYLRLFLRMIVLAVAVVSASVILDQVATGSYNAAGLFRSRSHMGIYSFGAIWLLLILFFWPGTRAWERFATLLVLGATLYGVAASMRQSIYVAAMAGIALLAGSFVVARGRQRFQISTLVLVLTGFGALLYWQGEAFLPQMYYFKREFNELSLRLEEATETTAESLEVGTASFDALQRAGAIKAFQENPILGIGWLGFWRSSYSPTGNELHSTPLRMLAELGIFGFSLYMLYMVLLFIGVIRLFWRARSTPYQLSTLVLVVAFTAVTISHWYNRMFTDRPYWILLIVFLVMERIITQKIQSVEGLTVAEGARVKGPLRDPAAAD